MAQGSLEKEFEAWLQAEMKPKMTKALLSLRDDMRESLSEHVVKDVYQKYSPAEYARREMNGGLQAQALNAESHANASPDGSSYRIYISFSPNGNHPDERSWAEDGVSPVHGDDFIGRIEKKNPRYSYPPRHKNLPYRPFWKNFVSDMVDAGLAEYFFARSMREQGEDVIEDGSIVREPNDGDY